MKPGSPDVPAADPVDAARAPDPSGLEPEAAAREAPLNGVAGAPSKTPPTPDGPGDLVLVQRVQNGDETAFRELFDRYHRRAYAVALGVVKNPQDALDVVQDGFIKVHRHIHNFQGSSSFYTWLYRIIMNLAIDHIRRHKKSRSLDYDDGIGREAGEVAGDGSLLPCILDGHPGKTVLRRELSAAMQAALDTLPEHHRAVILLREVEGMSYEEMATVLRVPKGTIMSRLFHARKKMQQALSAYFEGDLTWEE